MEAKIIDRIHKEFDYDIFEDIRKKDDSSFLDTLKPEGVSSEDFLSQATYYRTFYPGNNFITERQIANICNEFGLVLGSFMNFTGNIPSKNRLELKNFRLRSNDQVFIDESLPGRIVYRIAGDSNSNITEDVLTIKSGFVPGDMEKPFEVIPLGDTFVLVATYGSGEGLYRLYLKIDVYGSEWLADLGLVSIGSGSVWCDWKKTGAGKSDLCEVVLKLPATIVNRITAFNMASNVSPMVVAPGTMFERYKGAVEVDGYRIRFKTGITPADKNSVTPVDDPIILQPVPFGYLVVTKWGKEKYLPEFQDEKRN